MYHSFQEMEHKLLGQGIVKRVALANAQDEDALAALVHAKRQGVASGTLIGDVDTIRALLRRMNESEDDYRLLACEDERESARIAVGMVHEGSADIPMKGLMQTASFMKAILDKTQGFVPQGALLSQATVLEWPAQNKMLVISDCAVNISPDREAKVKITRNAVDLAHTLGVEHPNVALLSAVEVPKESIPSTLDAQAIAQMEWSDCVVGGPFALDNAISEKAARHKGITHPAAGKADVLILPDLCSGNIFTKSLTFFAGLNSAGALCGTTRPVVMTSRTDTPEDKYYSILTAIIKSL